MGSQDSRWTIPVASLVIVVSAILVLSSGQTHTHAQTDANEHFTPATLVDVSKDKEIKFKQSDDHPLTYSTQCR